MLLMIALLPACAGASTPPVQPLFSFHISPESGNSDTTFTFSAVWEAVTPYNIPPDQINVDFYVEPAGSIHGGGIVLLPVDGSCGRTTCIYAATVGSRQLSSGTLMVIATDPVSGITDRQPLTITVSGNDNTGFVLPPDHTGLFYIASGILGLALICILVMLVRPKTS